MLLPSPASGQVITVQNQLANGYKTNPFPSPCPSPYTLETPSGYHIERPHVMYNSRTQQWVLWAHYENPNYTTAEAVVATSQSQCGPYTTYATFRPLGFQSRDENIFQDDDGAGYFITASNHHGGANDTLAIFKMTPDYLGIDASAGVTWAFDNAYREAPAVAKVAGTYFLLTSQAAGWFPSQGGYAVSSSMTGAWGPIQKLGNSSTFGGQQADLIAVKGTQATSYYMVLDHLGGNLGRDDGALWLPVFFDGAARTARLEWYTHWTVDLSTGLVNVPNYVNYAPGGLATADSALGASPAQNAIDGDYSTSWIASAATWPIAWQVDLQGVHTIEEIDISWFMYKGSEGYYQYKIDWSIDGQNWNTLDRTGNQLYGFTTDQRISSFVSHPYVDAGICDYTSVPPINQFDFKRLCGHSEH